MPHYPAQHRPIAAVETGHYTYLFDTIRLQIKKAWNLYFARVPRLPHLFNQTNFSTPPRRRN